MLSRGRLFARQINNSSWSDFVTNINAAIQFFAYLLWAAYSTADAGSI
jgi:hypothetical protein